MKSCLAVDTETTGLEPWKGHYPFMITACDEDGNRFAARLRAGPDGPLDRPGARLPKVWPKAGPRPADLIWAVKSDIPGLGSISEFKEALLKHQIVMHNAKFDLTMLRYAGFELSDDVHDTMIIARLAMPGIPKVALKDLSRRLLKVDYDSEVQMKRYMKAHNITNYVDVPEEMMTRYATDDAYYTMVLYAGLKKKVPSQELLDYEHKLIPIIAAMESRGMLCDLEYAREQAAACREAQEILQNHVDTVNGGPINLNSPRQLQSLLFDKLKLQDTLSLEDRRRYASIIMTPKGLYSTRREALKIYDHTTIKAIMEYRMYGKMAGTYFEKFLELADDDGVIHSSIWQNGARTGRLTGSNPSFQTIPSVTSGRLLDFDRGKIPDVRHCFGPRPGYNMYAPDFSQIELRIAAWYAGEEVMIEAFINGRDIHDETTKAIFPDDWETEPGSGKVDKPKRTFCKMVNFGVIYGMGVKKLSADLGVPVDRAKRFLDQYFVTYPALKSLMQRCQRDIITKGYVESIYGRRCTADPETAYVGLNYLVQGTAADVMKRTLIRVHELLQDYHGHLLNTVHDELIFEIRQEYDTTEFHYNLQQIMQHWPEFDPVPLPVNCKKVIDRWGNHEVVW